MLIVALIFNFKCYSIPFYDCNYCLFKMILFFFLQYLLSFDCAGSSLLRLGFLQLQQAGATLQLGVCGLLSAGASLVAGQRLRRAQAQQLWCTGLVARHVGSSRIRDRAQVPCIGRHILSHWTPREVLPWIGLLIHGSFPLIWEALSKKQNCWTQEECILHLRKCANLLSKGIAPSSTSTVLASLSTHNAV